MACSTFARVGIWSALTLAHGAAWAAKQPDAPLPGPPQSQYAVGDQVPLAVRLDDEGGPNRRYGILIVEGSIVVIIDRATRRVVQIMR
jgi:hypothetical protein